MLDATQKYLYFLSLEKQLRECAPELGDRIERPDVQPFFIKVGLEGETCVRLAQTRIGGDVVWCLADPKYPLWPRVWSLGTPAEVLVEAMRARAMAWINGTPEPSPWCWDEPEESPVTLLADLLSLRGLAPRVVVAQNRCYVVAADTPDARAARRAGRAKGAFLLIHGDQYEIRVTLKNILGWVVDVRDDGLGDWRRADLGLLLAGQPLPAPGAARDAIPLDALADLVASTTAGLQPDGGGVVAPGPILSAPLPVLGEPAEQRTVEQVENVAMQLRAMGFRDIEAAEDEPSLRSEAFHIVWWDRSKELGLSDLQRFNGLAAVEEKKLMVIVRSRVTQPAAEFADQAKAFVFRLDEQSGCLRGSNVRAEEAHLPDWNDWALRHYRLSRGVGAATSGAAGDE